MDALSCVDKDCRFSRLPRWKEPLLFFFAPPHQCDVCQMRLKMCNSATLKATEQFYSGLSAPPLYSLSLILSFAESCLYLLKRQPALRSIYPRAFRLSAFPPKNGQMDTKKNFVVNRYAANISFAGLLLLLSSPLETSTLGKTTYFMLSTQILILANKASPQPLVRDSLLFVSTQGNPN